MRPKYMKLKVVNIVKAEPTVIRANIWRIFGGVDGAYEATGISKSQWFVMAAKGEISEFAIGRLWRLGLDPKELVRENDAKKAAGRG